MKLRFFLLCSVAALIAGCGNNSGNSGAQPTNATAGSSPANAPAEYLGALARAQQSAQKKVDVAAIDKAIQMFQVDNGRYPSDLNELVREKYLPRIPGTPVGTKLSYNPATGQVTVVSQ